MKKLTLTLLFTFVLLFCAINNSIAQQIGFKGIGGRLGFVKPQDVDLNIGFGAHVNLGELIENLVLYPGVDYWSKLSINSFTINGDVRYYFPSESNFNFFVGGGLAFSLNSAEPPVGEFSNDDIGLNLLGGADFPLSENLVVTVEAKILVSDANAFKLFGGITYLLRE